MAGSSEGFSYVPSRKRSILYIIIYYSWNGVRAEAVCARENESCRLGSYSYNFQADGRQVLENGFETDFGISVETMRFLTMKYP